MNDVPPTDETSGPETSDDLQEISTEAVTAPKKRRLRIALAAGVALLLLVALLAVTLGRDSGRSVTLVLVDKTSENPLPPDFSVSIASDAPQYPKMKGKRADLDLGHVGSAGKPLAITFKAPDKSVVKFVFPKKLPSGDLVIVASLGDSAITARLGNATAEASRKNPAQLARDFAESENQRLNDGVALESEAFNDPNILPLALWDASDNSDQFRFGLRQISIPRAQAYITALETFDTVEPYVKERLQAELDCTKKILKLWEDLSIGRNSESEVADMRSSCKLALEAQNRLIAFLSG